MLEIPHVIKYMGSKRNILDFVVKNIDASRKDGQRLYDVFGGSAVVAGAFRDKMPVTCNDIQKYTSVIAGLYLNNYKWKSFDQNILEEIVARAENFISDLRQYVPEPISSYTIDVTSFEHINRIEQIQRQFIERDFPQKDHLFTKYYSGTYWSFEQCLWIDALSYVSRSDEYRNTFLYNVILCSLMFAMAYTSQSTGHYAQYRDLTEANMNDILTYRKKSILALFKQKFNELRVFFKDEINHSFKHECTNLDYLEILKRAEKQSIVYADPPYQFVHYSRFYHALETLVRYDYPQVSYKGRYRTDRHQSPFCIRTRVSKAFENMFNKVHEKNSTLILSYSDNGMISLDGLLTLATKVFKEYSVTVEELEHVHSTMGRQGDKSRDVKEILVICSPA